MTKKQIMIAKRQIALDLAAAFHETALELEYAVELDGYFISDLTSQLKECKKHLAKKKRTFRKYAEKYTEVTGLKKRGKR